MKVVSSIIFLAVVVAGVSGFAGVSAAQGTPVKNEAPLLPDVNPVSAPPAPVIPTPATTAAAPVPAAATPAPPVVKDPCEAYQATYEAYVICQDQIKKIQRMKDAQTEREAPPPPPETKPASTAPVPEAPAPAEKTAVPEHEKK